jgi:hypothetical protein
VQDRGKGMEHWLAAAWLPMSGRLAELASDLGVDLAGGTEVWMVQRDVWHS